MSSSKESAETLYLGIDGGGSKCRATLVSSTGEIVGVGLSGPANPLHGLERTLESIEDASVQAAKSAGLADGNLSNIVAGIGLAGVNLPGQYEQVASWQHPYARCYLTTDLHVACLGAHRGDDGAVIVVGTGSCGFSAVNGKSVSLGGHGFLLGDKGSGAWMGLKAIKSVLTAADELSAPTQLTQAVTDVYQVSGLEIIERLSKSSSSDFARLAPRVIQAAEAGDQVAMNIVSSAADYVSALARKLLATQPPRLSLIGGISGPLSNWLADDVLKRIEEPLDQPEMGAVYFARQQHQRVLSDVVA